MNESSCRLLLAVCVVLSASVANGQESADPARCEIVPLADHRVSFQIEGIEKTRWHYGTQYPRPFFFPFNGPAGSSLTRMGHPGASNHDHHRSVWFAHHSIEGSDYWSENGGTQIRQKMWYSYTDGADEAVMACLLGWHNADNQLVMEQELVAALIPLADGEHALELQITLRPPAGSSQVELDKTNFGVLAVRVAKSISAHFGGGQLASSEGAVSERNLFGKSARWMDYSGKVTVGSGPGRKQVVEGITYFDHPLNPRYPTHWHVRDDGWMGASFCMHEAFNVKATAPLVLRYLLHAHRGPYDQAKADRVHTDFSKRPGFQVGKSPRKHEQYEAKRKP